LILTKCEPVSKSQGAAKRGSKAMASALMKNDPLLLSKREPDRECDY
jgi:hypothetical protein